MKEFFDSASEKLNFYLSNDAIVETIEKGATKTAYAASGVTIFSGVTVNEWGVIVGMALGVATFAFNVWFKMKYGRGNKNDE